MDISGLHIFDLKQKNDEKFHVYIDSFVHLNDKTTNAILSYDS